MIRKMALTTAWKKREGDGGRGERRAAARLQWLREDDKGPTRVVAAKVAGVAELPDGTLWVVMGVPQDGWSFQLTSEASY